MALPQLEEFDLEGAAEYLDCGVDELSLHLHKGAIRLGITTEGLDYDFAVLLEDLPLRIQREVTGVLADGNFVDITKPITMDQVPASAFNPRYIYLSRENKQLLCGSSHGQIIQEFQSLDGQPLTIWLNGELDSAFIKRLFLILDDEGWITHTVITKEELDRFSGNAGEKIDEEKTNSKHELFDYPNLADEIARLMTDQMNQFIRENGFVASEQTLRDFIVERTYVSYDHRDKQLEIGEEEDRPVYLSFRSFKQRYNKYFDQN